MKLLFAAAVVIFLTAAQAVRSEPEIPLGSVGPILRVEDNAPCGTGFRCLDLETVVTCAHVTPSGGHYVYVYFDDSTNSVVIPLIPKFAFPKHDVIVFRLAKPAPGKPFPLGDVEKIRPGDFVHYVAANFEKKTIVQASTEVGGVGYALGPDSVVVRFIEFGCPCLPGFSGGPVLNEKGEVIGLIRESWNRIGIKGGPERQVTRAFSIDLLKAISQDMRLVTPLSMFVQPRNLNETMSALTNGEERSKTDASPPTP